MSDKSTFTDDEWHAMTDAPMLISMAMVAVGSHGPISMVKESAATAKSITQPTDHGPANALIAEIAKDAQGKEARSDAKHHKAATIPLLVDALFDDLAPANAALDKLPDDEAAGVRAWYLAIAESVAAAAKGVTADETAAIERLETVFS